MKKFVSLFVCGVVMFSLSSAMAQEDNKLVIWSHWASEPIKIQFMNAVVGEFQQATGAQVEVVWMEKDALYKKLIFALNAGEPDVCYLDFGFEHPRILRELADLGDLKLPAAGLAPDWRLADIGAQKHAFVPIEGASNAMYYNKDLFKQAGITLPQDRLLTSAEFLDIIRKLRAAGIQPIAEGAGSADFKFGIPIMNTIFRLGGAEKVLQLLKKEITFSDPVVVEALTFWKQVVDAQAYNPSELDGSSLPDGIFEMTDGKAAINFCGTWIYSKFGATERDRGQVGVLDWFTFENGKGNAQYEEAWVSGYGMNKNTTRPELAKRFLEFLLTPEAAMAWAKHVQSPYPVMMENVPENSLYSALAKGRKGQQAVTTMFSYPYWGSPASNAAWNEGAKRLIKGEFSVPQFIEFISIRVKK